MFIRYKLRKTGSITQSWYQIIQGSFIAGKNVQLMEVNLKDDAAMEDFYLSSLRIWTAK